MYVRKIKIGDIELKNNVFLAPMAGITDKPFRIMCEKYSNPRISIYRNGKCKSYFL
jgi:tRNA-dihydrouridine synthase